MPEARARKTTSAKPTDLGEAEVQHNKDVEDERGYRGFKVDPTPNEHYTVAGVIAGLPTPETDPDHAAKVRAQLDAAARGAQS